MTDKKSEPVRTSYVPKPSAPIKPLVVLTSSEQAGPHKTPNATNIHNTAGSPKSSRLPKLPKLALSFCVIVVLVIGLFGFSRTEAFKLATTHQPEPFTELYFTDPATLASSISLKSTVVKVPFSLHNQETGAMSYPYVITYTDASGTTTLDKSTTSAAQGAVRNIAQPVTVPAGTSRGEIIITVLSTGETIHMWLTRTQAAV